MSAALALMLWPSVVSATTYYVQGGGTGVNCTQYQTLGTPAPTIAAGRACLSTSGDTLLIRAGTYVEVLADNNMPSGTSWTNLVRVANYNGESVTVRPTSSSSGRVINFTDNSAYIEFDGINLDATLIAGAVQLYQFSGNGPNHIRVTHADIHGGPTFGTIAVFASTTAAIGANEFVANVVHDCGDIDSHHCFYVNSPYLLIDGNTISGFAGAGIHAINSPDIPTPGVVIRNNDISHPRDTINADKRHWGILIGYYHTGTRVYNNVVHDITSHGSIADGIVTYSYVEDIDISFNTVYNAGADGIQVDTDAQRTVVYGNISYGNGVSNFLDFGTDTTGSGTNLFGVDPTFVSGTDFHLQATSAAISAGGCLGTVLSDKDGVSRPQGLGCDRGAYEYLASGSLPGIPANIFPANGATNVVLFPPPLSFTSTNATAFDFYLASYVGAGPALLTDFFDGTSPDLGTLWTPYLIGLTSAQRFNNLARSTSTALGSAERATVTLAADQWARMRLITFGPGFAEAAFFLHLQSSVQPSGYFISVVNGEASGYRTRAYRYDNGAYTFLAGESTTPWANDDFMEAHMVGNVMSIYRNGSSTPSLVATDPLAAYPAGGTGLYLYASTIGQVEVNNFEAGSLGPVFQGTFSTASFPLTGLMPAQTYYWKPAGRNSTGVTEGAINTFTTETSSVPVTPIGVRLRFKSP
jgi:hypothetical protein